MVAMKTLTAAVMVLTLVATPVRAPVEFTPMPAEIPVGQPLRVTVTWENPGTGDMLIEQLSVTVRLASGGRPRGVIDPFAARFSPIGFSPGGLELVERPSSCTWSLAPGQSLKPGQWAAMEVWIPTVDAGDVVLEVRTSAAIGSRVVEEGRGYSVRVAAVRSDVPVIVPPAKKPDPAPRWAAVGPVPGGPARSVTDWDGTVVVTTETGLFAYAGSRWQDIAPVSGSVLAAADGETLFAFSAGAGQKAYIRGHSGQWEAIEAPPGSVRAVAAGSGRVLAGGSDGLFSWTNGRWKQELNLPVAAIGPEAGGCVTEDGKVWRAAVDGWRAAADGAVPNGPITAVTMFGRLTYVAAAGSLWREGSQAWEKVLSGEPGITALASGEGYLYAVIGGQSGRVWSFDGTVWSEGPKAAVVCAGTGRYAWGVGDELWRVRARLPLILTTGSLDMRRGQQRITASVAFVREGRAYAALRAVIEALGGVVSYDSERRTAACRVEGTVVTVDADRSVLIRDGSATACDVLVYDQMIVVPVRAVAELCGAEVAWDEGTGRIAIWP